MKTVKVCDIYGAAQFGKLLAVLDRKLSSVRGLSCSVLLRNWDEHPYARTSVKVEHDFERRGRNLATRGIEGKSQNSGLPVACTRFELGTLLM